MCLKAETLFTGFLRLLFLVAGLLLTSFCPRRFPHFTAITFDGQAMDQTYFQKKKTLVILGHLGCPPFMEMLKDLQENPQDDSIQKLIFLENSKEQFASFNDSAGSMAAIRSYFKLSPIQFPVICECENQPLKRTKNGSVSLGPNCRKIARKLWTRSSPTYFLVDTSGKILVTRKGYAMGQNLAEKFKHFIQP